MNWILFVSTFITGIAAPLAYPQDAELLHPDTPFKDSHGRDDEGILIVNIEPSNHRRNSLPSLFSQIFGTSFLPTHFGPPVFSDGPSLLPDLPVFPDVSFDFPAINELIPSNIPKVGDVPDDYTNSTYDVKVVNGTRIETNMTVTKNRDENGGVFVQEVHIIRYIPEEDSHKMNASASPGDTLLGTGKNNPDNLETTTTDYEDFGMDTKGTVSTPFNVRTRRWAIPKFIQRYFSSSEPKPTSTRPPTTFRSYHGDTRVNYLDSNRNGLEEDAEIFDPKLLMNNGHHSYHGDTRVNYLDPIGNSLDEDAEIFDPESLMNDKDQVLFSKPNPSESIPESHPSPKAPKLSLNPHISVPEGGYNPNKFLSGHRDTRVNYLNSMRNGLDEDAEIFDPNSLMNDRHHVLFSKPILSESVPESQPFPVYPKLSFNNRPHISGHEGEYNSNRLLSGHRDTRVNYLTPMRNGLEEDAEIFDSELMVNDMHYGLSSQPIISSKPSKVRSFPGFHRVVPNNRPYTSISVHGGEYSATSLLPRNGNNRFEKYSYFNSQNGHRRRGRL